MELTKPFFLSVTQRIFSNWTALKLAVEHDMGPLECAIEFCSYMTEVLYMNDGLTNDQIAEELENYMEDQFNTEIQDESTPQIAAELLRFYQYCTAGNESTARVEFDELPALQSWLVPGQSSQSIRHQPSPVQRDECSNEDMDVDENQEEDGWTTVTKRRNR